MVASSLPFHHCMKVPFVPNGNIIHNRDNETNLAVFIFSVKCFNSTFPFLPTADYRHLISIISPVWSSESSPGSSHGRLRRSHHELTADISQIPRSRRELVSAARRSFSLLFLSKKNLELAAEYWAISSTGRCSRAQCHLTTRSDRGGLQVCSFCQYSLCMILF